MATDFQPPERLLPPLGHARAEPSAPSPCSTYTLHYEEDAFGVEKRVEFEALSPAYALDIARGEAEGRRALLLENGRPLCRLEKATPGETPFWIVAQRPDRANPRDPQISMRGMNDGKIDTRQDSNSQDIEGAIADGV